MFYLCVHPGVIGRLLFSSLGSGGLCAGAVHMEVEDNAWEAWCESVSPLFLSLQDKMMEPELLTEVPAALKRLAKQVVRGFYGMEHALALDVLIRNPCVREEDILELLKFDRKQLRSVLNTLKADKFVKCRMRVETAPDGKTTRHNYYFINYRWSVSCANDVN